MATMNLGIELEYPTQHSEEAAMTDVGLRSDRLTRQQQDTVRSELWGVFQAGHDPTVGIEVASDKLTPSGARDWYRDAIEVIHDTTGQRYAPVGQMADSTAGLHIHLSPLTESEARELAEYSTTAELQAFACSSVVAGDAPNYSVCRGGSYLQMNYGTGHHCVVNKCGPNHYEWRLPEPSLPAHFDHIVEFLRRWCRSPERGRRYVRQTLEDPDTVITSVERARAIGTDWPEDTPATVDRTAHPDTEGWFRSVFEDSSAPYVFHVELGDGHYYGFHSHDDRDPEIDGVTVQRGRVLDARTLEVVEDSETVETVNQEIEEHRRGTEDLGTPAEKLREVYQSKVG